MKKFLPRFVLVVLLALLASCTTSKPKPPVPPLPPTHVLRLLPRLSNTNGWATLAWDYGTNDPTVVGFRVYQGGTSGVYTNFMVVPGLTNRQCTFSNLVRNVPYYFAATAFNAASLESLYSMETNYTYKVAPPLSNVFYTITAQSATNLAAPVWVTFTNLPTVRLTNPPAPAMYLRLSITATNF